MYANLSCQSSFCASRFLFVVKEKGQSLVGRVLDVYWTMYGQQSW